MMQKIADYYKNEGDKGRTLAYNKAASSLRTVKEPIKDAQ